jgi:bisphosphoglycerate-independent phosphoglycerate mutase (AlkP superfamily)
MAVQIQRNDTIQQLVDKDIRLIHDGVLGDIAPTILELLGVENLR